jgi:hypothetical protein
MIRLGCVIQLTLGVEPVFKLVARFAPTGLQQLVRAFRDVIL